MKYIFLINLIFCVSLVFSQSDCVVVKVGETQIEMVYVKGGSFERGCDPQNANDTPCAEANRNKHTVELRTFYMAKYEVTQRLFHQVMGTYPSWFTPKMSSEISLDGPVECVSWYDAQVFIDSLNKITGKHFRLPTEAEWEYAARGGMYQEKYKYAGSNELDKVAWFYHGQPNRYPEYYIGPHKVGEKQPNALGLYDMSGNVAEWCSDWYSSSYYQTQKYFKNPQGPHTGEKKVVRDGSSAYGMTKLLEVRSRKGVDPSKATAFIGFRLAMDAEK